MINNFRLSHKGTQPIRVLQHNIIKQFEDTTPEFKKLTIDTVIEKGLQLGIGYVISEMAVLERVNGHVQTPFVDSHKKIYVHETFASYVWCVAYSLIVLYEEAVAKPSQNLFLKRQEHKIDPKKISEAQAIFDYGISLIRVFIPWDKTLPNPELYLEENKFYIERTNSVFIYAMNFILCHEFIHVESGHMDRLLEGTPLIDEKIAFEQEADKKSIELVLSGVTKEKQQSAIAGILIGICSLLYFSNETLSRTHPDTNKRIDGFLQNVNQGPTHPIWGIAALAYRLWDLKFTKAFSYPSQVTDFKEMYERIKELVEAENAQARARI